MGCSSSRETQSERAKMRRIPDAFKTYDAVQAALREAGLESSELIIGIDCSASNVWNGKKTFNKRSLHDVVPGGVLPPTPYEQVIEICGRTLEPFDDDNLIPVYGFADATSTDKGVFAFNVDDRPCEGFEEVLQRYREVIPSVSLGGPTTFGPIIRKAVEITREANNSYHILVILADGHVTRSVDVPAGQMGWQEQDTIDALVEASNFPLSVVVVGVGDADDFGQMETLDDAVPNRAFDNLQFVDFDQVRNEIRSKGLGDPDATFAMWALMEVPDQFSFIQRLGLMGRRNTHQIARAAVPVHPPPDLGGATRTEVGSGASAGSSGRRGKKKGAAKGKTTGKGKTKTKKQKQKPPPPSSSSSSYSGGSTSYDPSSYGESSSAYSAPTDPSAVRL